MSDATKPWPFYGYAPGGYTFTCKTCGRNALKDGSSFTDVVALADKRATMCLECAVVKAKDDITRLQADLKEAVDEGNRLRRMCERRDEFIISKSLWPEFRELIDGQA